MVLFRRMLGEALRQRRQEQERTLRDLCSEARVSLGYMSEIERGRKEASSELLSAICAALDVPLSEILAEVADAVALEEAAMAMRLEQVQQATVPDAPTGVGHGVPGPGPAGHGPAGHGRPDVVVSAA